MFMRKLSVLVCLVAVVSPVNALANDCSTVFDEGVLSVSGGSFSGDISVSADDFDDAAGSALCGGTGYGPGGVADNIHAFQVSQNGLWTFDTGCPGQTNVFDTSIHIREDTGGGCPGDIISCNGDGCGGTFGSTLSDFLLAGVDYFLVVEGYSSMQNGAYTVDWAQTVAPCALDSECSDGDFCNGAESCDAIGQCQSGSPPCPPWQTCNSGTGTCSDSPPDCTAVLKPGGNCGFSGFCLLGQTCIGCGYADDITLRDGAGRDLISYSFQIVGQAVNGAVIGDQYTISTDLYTITVDGNPGIPIPGTHCDFNYTIQSNGSPAETPLCEPNSGLPTGIILEPGFFGSEGFLVYRSTTLGSSFFTAIGPPIAGGDMNPSTFDGIEAEYGQSIFWVEGTPSGEDWGPGAFPAPTVSDFGGLTVCTDPVGPCCEGNTCSMLNEGDCFAAGGTFPFGVNVLDNQVTCSDTDCDGDGFAAGDDNCSELANADQANADGDAHGDLCDNCIDAANDNQIDGDGDTIGDACDNCPVDGNEDQANADGDAHGDVCDNCIDNANDNQSTSGDADIHPDACDNCPTVDNENQANADGDVHGDICDNCPNLINDNQADADGDSVGDACDDCPNDVNKIEPGLCGCGRSDAGDTDGDGVLDCVDVCLGADDAVFGNCQSAIPTVSSWGLVVLTLLLMVGVKISLGLARRRDG
ncbi:hypothetical protein JYU10_00095 [bacterium AH-315-J04]|nr:hypothetical protein [bacterium AH-315-J04]